MTRQQLEAEVRRYSQTIRRLGKQGATVMRPRIVRANISSADLEQRLQEMKKEVARVVETHRETTDTFKATEKHEAGQRVNAALDAASKEQHKHLLNLLNKIRYEDDPSVREELYNQLWDETDEVINEVLDDEQEDNNGSGAVF